LDGDEVSWLAIAFLAGSGRRVNGQVSYANRGLA